MGAIGAQRDTLDARIAGGQSDDRRSRNGVPEPGRPVLGDGEHAASITAENRTCHRGGMTTQSSECRPIARVPDACGAVLACGKREGAVGIEGDGVDRACAT